MDFTKQYKKKFEDSINKYFKYRWELTNFIRNDLPFIDKLLLNNYKDDIINIKFSNRVNLYITI